MGEEESERHREEEVWGGGCRGGIRYGAHGAQRCKALEVLCNSAAPERLAGKQQREKKNPKSPHLKKHSLWCFSSCSLHTEIQSEPPLCMVLKLDYEVANAFSAADKRSGFSSLEKVCEDFSPLAQGSKTSTPEVGNLR